MEPKDLSHHFSKASKKRVANIMKEYYRFLRIPGMGSFAGGSPCAKYFPFNSLEVSIAPPDSLLLEEKEEEAQISPLVSQKACYNKLKINRTSKSSIASQQIDLDSALNYGIASGYPALYLTIKRLVTQVYFPNIPYHGGPNVIMCGGSADGLAKIYEVFFNTWDEESHNVRDRQGLLVEEFVYPPAIAQIRHKDVNIVPVKMDSEGFLVGGSGGLLDVLQNWDFAKGKRPHMLYSVPTGQNPTSGVLSYQRKKDIYNVCTQYDVMIIEDDPYWSLYYPPASGTVETNGHGPTVRSSNNNLSASGELDVQNRQFSGKSGFLDQLVPSFLEIDIDGRVIRLDTFSKTLAPGCRLGYITAQPNICEQLFRVTDATTQQPSGFVQAIVAKLIGGVSKSNGLATVDMDGDPSSTSWGFEGWLQWLEILRDKYKSRMELMASIFKQGAHKAVGDDTKEMFSFSIPRGGMFIWLKVNIEAHPLAAEVDKKRLMLALWILCTQEPYRIIMNPGKDFAANDEIRNEHGYLYLRFCFAAVDKSLLKTKSEAFTLACSNFWDLTDASDIDKILEEEDRLIALTNGDVDGVDVERMNDDC